MLRKIHKAVWISKTNTVALCAKSTREHRQIWTLKYDLVKSKSTNEEFSTCMLPSLISSVINSNSTERWLGVTNSSHFTFEKNLPLLSIFLARLSPIVCHFCLHWVQIVFGRQTIVQITLLISKAALVLGNNENYVPSLSKRPPGHSRISSQLCGP